jgi:hypothetical protein
MRRPLALATVAVTLGLPHAAAAPSEPTQPNPLEDARRAAVSLPFSGRVVVEWREGGVLRRTKLDVKGKDGAFYADGQRQIMAVGTERLMHGSSDGWHELWPSGLGGEQRHGVPPRYNIVPTDENHDSRPDEGSVAAHPTARFDVAKGRLRERLDLDRDTKFLLAREQFGGDGTTVEQAFRFESIKLPDPDVKLPAAPPVPVKNGPQRMERPSAGEPDHLRSGYVRVAVYRPPGLEQVVYGDGFYDLSLFRERGRVDNVDLPARRMARTAGGRRYWEFSWPGGQGVVWSAGGTVYTLVGDAPSDELVNVAASVPVHRSTSVFHRLRQACRTVVESFRGRF